MKTLPLWLIYALFSLSGCGQQEPPPPTAVPTRAESLVVPTSAENLDCDEIISVHCGATPTVQFDNRGRLWAIFAQQGHAWVVTSEDLGATYSTPVLVNPEPEAIETNGENRPKIVAVGEGVVYVSWTKKTEGRFTGDIRFSRSLDDGNSFEAVRTINDDGLQTGHRFESLQVDDLGHVYLTWIDKRDREAAKSRGEKYRGAAIYYTVSTDKGATFAANRRVANSGCECCRIGVTKQSGGGVAVLWRHIFSTNTRDHAFATLGVEDVSSPMQRATYDGWQIDGCPHHGPAMVPAGESQYHLTWFTAAAEQPTLYYGRFDPNEEKIHHQIPMATTAVAHPDLAQTEDVLMLAWKALEGETMAIFQSKSFDQGVTWSAGQVVATAANGDSDHPFLVERNGEIFLSWHSRAEGLRILPLS